MSEWKIKGAVDSDETKSAQEQEQAVLDTAVEKGEIAPESAGKNEDEVPVINLDEVDKPAEPVEEKETIEAEVIPTPEENTGVEDTPLELVTDEEETQPQDDSPKVDQRAAERNAQPEIELPENVDKLVKFMQETGGTVEDYVMNTWKTSSLMTTTMTREKFALRKERSKKSCLMLESI